MNRRTRRTLWTVAAVLVALAAAIFLRSKAPPEAARLLPESDGIVYINLRPVRAFFHKEIKPPARAPEYQQFIDATGIDWERDLDEAAVALHRMSDPSGPNGAVAYSMVLVGKITGKKLNTWLEAHSTSREIYAGHTVYSIPSEGRTVRVAQIGYDMVAVSNTPTAEQIHSMLDRHATAAWPFAGSTLLRLHYNDVPLLSQAWGVGQIGLPFAESRGGAISLFGLTLPLASDATIVASVAPELSMAGALRLRVEEIAPTEIVAARQAAALATVVTLGRGFTAGLNEESSTNGEANRALIDLLKSAEVTQKRNRVVVTATLSRAIFSGTVANEGALPDASTVPGAAK
jgi:hypothetical protein